MYTEKVWKIGKIRGWNTNLKLSCAFFKDRTENMLHPRESYIDIAQNFTTQGAEMRNMLDFSKLEKNRA